MSNYKIRLDHDDFGEDPRDWNTISKSKMICWHSRYDLGDKHSYKDPQELFATLFLQTMTPGRIKKLITDVKKGLIDNIRLEYSREVNLWFLKQKSIWTLEWYEVTEYYPPIDLESEEIVRDILDIIEPNDLRPYLEDKFIFKPLYLYDHSGITMNTKPFSCIWDSGQVGFIYAEVGIDNLTKEELDKVLESEVKEYDEYISGEVYYIEVIDEKGEVVDSLNGILGYSYALEEVEQFKKQYEGAEVEDE